MKLVFFGKEKIIQKVSIVLLLCRYFKRDGAKYKCLYKMWRCTVFWQDFHNPLFSAGNSNSSLDRKFKKCQLLLCRYYTEPNTNVFIRCDGAVFWRDFHNQLFRREIQILHFKFEKCQLLLCRNTLQPNVFIRCDSAQWEIFGKRQNCRRWIRFFGQIWDEARRCTLGDYWRFGSRLIDMTQCLHSGIPTLMTTSIWRDFSHLTPVWT